MSGKPRNILHGLLIITLLIANTAISAILDEPASTFDLAGGKGYFITTDIGNSSLLIQITIPQTMEMAINPDSSIKTDFLDASSLPIITRWIVVPPGKSRANVKILEQSGRQGTIIGNNNKVDNVQSTSYTLNSNLWNKVISLGQPQTMRGIRLIPLVVNPLQYDQISGNVFETEYVSFQVEFTNEFDGRELFFSEKPLTDPFKNALAKFTLNPRIEWSTPRRDIAESDAGKMLILYPATLEDEEALNALNSFTSWKLRLGYDVELLQINFNNHDVETVRELVRERYENDGLDYLLIIGVDLDYLNYRSDAQLVFPSFFIRRDVIPGEQGQPDEIWYYNSDLMFGLFDDDETDILPEIIVARMMVPTPSKLVAALNRSKEYEWHPEVGNWMGSAAAVSDHSDPEANLLLNDVEYVHWMRHGLGIAGYSSVESVFGNRDNRTAGIIRSLLEDNGLSIILDDGYLWGAADPFNPGDVANTGRKNPFIVGNANHYGPPIFYPFFSSADNQNLTGPIGALGVFSYSWENHYIKPFLSGVINSIQYNNEWKTGDLYLGALFSQASRLQNVINLRNDSIPALIDNARLFRLLGDPTVAIYSKLATQLETNIPDELPAGARSFSMVVVDEDGRAIPEVMVCVRQHNLFQYVDYTDLNGRVRFTIPDGLVEGNLMITASKQNYLPIVTNVPVDIQRINLSLVDWEMNDAQIGDNDGTLRNGERAELLLTFANDGPMDIENMFASFSTESDYLSFSRDRARLDNIDSGESGGLAEVVNLILSSECPGGTQIRIQIDLDGGPGLEAAIEFTTSGPRPEIDGEVITNNLIPGDEGTVQPMLINRGNMSTGALELRLVSHSPGVSITDGERDLNSLEPNSTARPAPFGVAVDNLFIPGQYADFSLEISSNDGYNSVEHFEVTIGQLTPEDPIGPDRYGYICFDNGDSENNWKEAPPDAEANWREINPDIEFGLPGTRLNLSDFGPGGETMWLRLPFEFKYYGQGFDSVAVNTNGWMSFDPSAADFVSHYNQPIPGAGAPLAQLCPLWQDLKVENNPFIGLYSYYKEDEGIYIVEWSKVLLYQAQPLVNMEIEFQVILFDPAIYQTPTGDGEILFQYKTIDAIAGNETHHKYAVIGIRNLDGSDGIQYSYWNTFHQAARPLENGLAIKFTTGVEMEYGSARVRVVSAENPEQGLRATMTHPRGINRRADANGNITLSSLRAGDYENVKFSLPGYSAVTTSFTILPDRETRLPNIELGQPRLRTTTDELTFDLRPDSVTNAFIYLFNDGSGTDEYLARIVRADGSDTQFDGLDTLRISTLLNNRPNVYGPVYVDADSLFYIPHKVDNNPHRISVVNTNGELVRFFDQPLQQESQDGFKNLAWDGEKLWGSVLYNNSETHLIAFDREGDHILADIISPLSSRGSLPVTYSSERNTLFIADDEKDLTELSPDGQIINQWTVRMPGQLFRPCGLAWNRLDSDDMPLYILEKVDMGGNVYRLRMLRFDPETGEVLFWRTLQSREGMQGAYGLTLMTRFCDPNRLAIAYVEDFSDNDWLFIRDVGPNVTFLQGNGIENRIGTIQPNGSQTLRMTFDATDVAEGFYPFAVRVVSTVNPQNQFVIPVNFTVDRNAEVGFEINQPTEFGLTALYPNPFNSRIIVSFVAPDNEPVKLTVFNISGQVVAQLWDGNVNGRTRVVWNASSNPSGIYIVRLESISRSVSNKINLMK